MAAVIGYLRLLPGASRVTGARYQQAPIPGDFWFEVFSARQLLGSEVPLASDPTQFVRPAPPYLVGGLTGATPVATVTVGAGGAGTLDFSDPANSGQHPSI